MSQESQPIQEIPTMLMQCKHMLLNLLAPTLPGERAPADPRCLTVRPAKRDKKKERSSGHCGDRPPCAHASPNERESSS